MSMNHTVMLTLYGSRQRQAREWPVGDVQAVNDVYDVKHVMRVSEAVAAQPPHQWGVVGTPARGHTTWSATFDAAAARGHGLVMELRGLTFAALPVFRDPGSGEHCTFPVRGRAQPSLLLLSTSLRGWTVDAAHPELIWRGHREVGRYPFALTELIAALRDETFEGVELLPREDKHAAVYL